MTALHGVSREMGRISIVPFEPSLLPAVSAFSQKNWRRPRSRAYFEWRYVAPQPFSRAFLAMRGESCVGMLFALRKHYLIDGVVAPCLEVFDWHSLPEVRGSGVGVRLMRAMMREPEWIVSMGGTHEVISALQLMGWTMAGEAQPYELPDPAASIGSNGTDPPVPRVRTQGWRGALAALTGRHPVAAPPGGEVTHAAMIDDLAGLYDGAPGGCDMVQVPDPDVLRWISASAWNGSYEFLTFRVAGRVRGWAMTRLYDWGFGLDGDLVDVFAASHDDGLYRWMVAEAVASLARAHPRRLRARASCPALRSALVANGFLTLGPPTPIVLRPGRERPGVPTIHITMNHADGPLLPYETDARLRARAAADQAGDAGRRPPVRPPSDASTLGSRP